MTKEFCDVCGRVIVSIDDTNQYKIKVRHRWFSGAEHGWERVTLCADCKHSFHKLWKMKRGATDCGLDTGADPTAKKVPIINIIQALRRELLVLEKMFKDW